jgi:hypothetical protein
VSVHGDKYQASRGLRTGTRRTVCAAAALCNFVGRSVAAPLRAAVERVALYCPVEATLQLQRHRVGAAQAEAQFHRVCADPQERRGDCKHGERQHEEDASDAVAEGSRRKATDWMDLSRR